MKNELKKTALVSEDREALRKGVSDVQAALDELMEIGRASCRERV